MELADLVGLINQEAAEKYRAVVYRTQYHDVKLLCFEGRLPEFICKDSQGSFQDKNYIFSFFPPVQESICKDSPSFQGQLYLGIDLEDKALRIYPLEEALSYLPQREEIILEGQPFLIQEGYSLKTREGGEARLSRDYIFNPQTAFGKKISPRIETGVSVFDSRKELVDRKRLGLEALDDADFSSYKPLTLKILRTKSGVKYIIENRNA